MLKWKYSKGYQNTAICTDFCRKFFWKTFLENRNSIRREVYKMKEYCNICGRELLEDVLVVDTSQDMKPIKFKDVHGDKSDLICIECAADSVENPPFLCSRCGQPVEFGEHFYVLKIEILKPGGPKDDLKESPGEEKCICLTCYEEFMNPEGEKEE